MRTEKTQTNLVLSEERRALCALGALFSAVIESSLKAWHHQTMAMMIGNVGGVKIAG
jgi:hypothetical protein